MKLRCDSICALSAAGVSPVVRLPVAVARQIHYFILVSQEQDEEDGEEAASRARCQEGE